MYAPRAISALLFVPFDFWPDSFGARTNIPAIHAIKSERSPTVTDLEVRRTVLLHANLIDLSKVKVHLVGEEYSVVLTQVRDDPRPQFLHLKNCVTAGGEPAPALRTRIHKSSRSEQLY